MNLESPLSTISLSCNKKDDLIAVGGRSVMKVLKLSDGEFKVHKILKTARTNNKVGTTDLAWNNYEPNFLASTTLLNSQVLLWDINQINVSRLNEKIGSHDQLISRLNWNQINSFLLASCSQDGFLKVWDKRERNEQDTFSLNHGEKIRDCQFSPFEEFKILASYNSGSIKLWDLKNYSTCVKEFMLHDTDVLSVDWHPELRNIFCSGSMHQNLHIWNVKEKDPIKSYKASYGISRVKWWKKNPQYIISSYQTNNFYTSMWNINIDNMPEFQHKGHKDVVTGFCWDNSQNRLITCSKDSCIIVQNFSDGFNCINNVSTNFTKFGENDEIYKFTYKKPFKANYNNIDYSGLEISNKVLKIEDDNRLKFQMNKTKLFKLSNSLTLNLYYNFTSKEIKELFENYTYLINVSGKNKINSNTLEHKLNEVIKITNSNLKYAKEIFKNYNHIAVWTQLKFLCELESFKKLEDKSISNKSSNELMTEIIKNNIIEIINFLINCHSDIWLSTIIIYLFNDLFNFNQKTFLPIVSECFENLRRQKMYKISAKLMKFSIFEDLKYNKINTVFLFCCKKCGTTFDSKLNPDKCGTCNIKFRCQIWYNNII